MKKHDEKMAAAPSDAMKRMPVGEPGWVARRRSCDCPSCPPRPSCACRRELPAGVRRAHVVGGLLVVALVVGVLLGRDPAPPPGLLFDGLVAAGCQLDVMHFFTTDYHVMPNHAQIFFGSLPCVADHCHLHGHASIDRCFPIDGRSPGCCLSVGRWNSHWDAPELGIVLCDNSGADCAPGPPGDECRRSKIDPSQLWTAYEFPDDKKKSAVCLDHNDHCLRLPDAATHPEPAERYGTPILLAPRGSAPAAEQKFQVGEHSIEYSGDAGYTAMHPSVCVAATAEDSGR